MVRVSAEIIFELAAELLRGIVTGVGGLKRSSLDSGEGHARRGAGLLTPTLPNRYVSSLVGKPCFIGMKPHELNIIPYYYYYVVYVHVCM